MNSQSRTSPSSADIRLDHACNAYDQGDFLKAFELYLPVAREGNPVAETMIGWLYESGCGVAVNQAEATKWYQLAAEQGYEEGCFFLARLMDTLGRINEAAVNYERSANLGNLTAAYRLGAFNNRYKTDKAYWLQRAASSGHIFAMILLGRRMMWRQVPGGFIKGMVLIVTALWQGIKLVQQNHLKSAWDHPNLSR